MLDKILKENDIEIGTSFECLELGIYLRREDNGQIYITPINNDPDDDREVEDREKMTLSKDGSIHMTTGLINEGLSGTILIQGEEDEEFLISLEDGIIGKRFDYGYLDSNRQSEEPNNMDFYENIVKGKDDTIKAVLEYAVDKSASDIGRKSYKTLLNLHVRAKELMERKRKEAMQETEKKLQERENYTTALNTKAQGTLN